jgi:hypothetical protein
MEKVVRELSDEEMTQLEAQRSGVRKHFEPDAQHKYDTVSGKIHVIDTIVRSNWVQRHETAKLESLGVTFGDALAQALQLKWVAIEDESGRKPGLVLEGTSVNCLPITTIAKRIQYGEEINVVELFAQACATILRMLEHRGR